MFGDTGSPGYWPAPRRRPLLRRARRTGRAAAQLPALKKASRAFQGGFRRRARILSSAPRGGPPIHSLPT